MPGIVDIVFCLFPLAIYGAMAAYFATSRIPRDQAASISPSMHAAAIAASLMAFLLVSLPGDAYYVGLKAVVPLVLLWLIVPLLGWNILPGIARPTLGTPLTYLQKRFELRVSHVASVVYLLGRGIVAAIVLAALARMVSIVLGDRVSPLVCALLLGLLGTGGSAVSGQRGGVYIAALLLGVIALGLPLAIATVITSNGNADHVWQVGSESQRTWIGDPGLDFSTVGIVWNLLPAAFCGMLVLLLGDEATALRLSHLASPRQVREAFVSLLIFVSVLVPMLLYVGLGLFAFYRDHAAQSRPQWILNVDLATRLSLTDPATQSPVIDPATGKPLLNTFSDGVRLDPTSGKPLLPWDSAQITAHNLHSYIQAGRIYNPNSREPIRSINDILDESGQQVDLRKIAAFTISRDGRPSEIVLHRRATAELWPYFIAQQAPSGVRGLLLAGLMAAALLATDISSLFGSPAIRRLLSLHSDNSQRVIGAIGSLGIMLLATLFTFTIPLLSDAAFVVVAASLTPLAGLVLLGLTSRRANTAVALATLATSVAVGIAVGMVTLRSHRVLLHPMAMMPLMLCITLLLGHVLAAIFGDSRRRGDLRGLVLGNVPIGALFEESTPPQMPAASPENERWR